MDRRASPGPEQPQTWHYGVMARWWAEFNVSGPEIEYFRTFVEDEGEPALDAGCGTGRLLLPYLRAGLDVDGCDVSPDMIALCREAAARDGLSPNLYVQALHELDLPRTYRTIFICGAFGLGSTRAQDLEALRRLYDHLEPGGTLVVDNEVPYAKAGQWSYWPKEKRRELPRPWPAEGTRRTGADGSEYELVSRLVELDPLRQFFTLELRARMWKDGTLVAEEEHRLGANFYFANELQLMLERAGFSDVRIRGNHAEEDPRPDHDFLAFIARK